MMQYKQYSQTYLALIFPDGRVEVRQAQDDSIEGCIYFTCATKAYKVTMALLADGVVSAKRKGWEVHPKSFHFVENSYYLGSILLTARDKDTAEYLAEVKRSEQIHEVCFLRSGGK